MNPGPLSRGSIPGSDETFYLEKSIPYPMSAYLRALCKCDIQPPGSINRESSYNFGVLSHLYISMP